MTDEPGSAGPSAASSGDATGQREYDEPESPSKVRINTINASGATFNLGGAEQSRQPELVSGPISRQEVGRILKAYVSRAIDGQIRAALLNSRCLIFLGDPGSGRRSAAVGALAAHVGEGSLVELGLYDSTDLHRFKFEGSCGYLLDASTMSRPATRFDGATLRRTQSELTANGSYLVIIGLNTAEWKRIDDQFTRGWTAPTLRDLIEARRFDPPLDPDNPSLCAVLGDSPTVGHIVEVLDRIDEGRADGRSDDDVLSELPERDRPQIQQWFAENQSLEAWLLMSVLVFFSSAVRADFDRIHERLQSFVQDQIPTGDDDSTLARTEFTRSVPAELRHCLAEVRQQAQAVEQVTIGRQLVCFCNELAAPIFLEEYWKAVPRRLQQTVTRWLASLGDQVEGETAQLLAQRTAELISHDADLGMSILELWAGTQKVEFNELAARTVDAMAAVPATRALAFVVARDWSKATKVVSKQYTALYVYTGRVGVFQVRQAIRVYRHQWPRRKFWATVTWAGFTDACAAVPESAYELANSMARLGVVRSGEIDDPAFQLLAHWFVDSPTEVPLALRLVMANRKASARIASVVACTLQRSYRHEHWLHHLVAWADAEEPEVSEAAVRLLHDTLWAVSRPQQRPPLRSPSDLPGRAEMICGNVKKFMGRARRRADGPSALAVERCTAVIDDVLKRWERNPELL